jgi:hypothetical protein
MGGTFVRNLRHIEDDFPLVKFPKGPGQILSAWQRIEVKDDPLPAFAHPLDLLGRKVDPRADDKLVVAEGAFLRLDSLVLGVGPS